jgi:molybdenum cofactor cytidylyltransferase
MKPQIRYGAVILAAGRSARMGCPKLLLPWGPTSVAGHLVSVWTSLGASQVAIVCDAKDQALPAELDRLDFPAGNRILNPEPNRGMFSSLQCAAEWAAGLSDLRHIVLVLGDQPHLRSETLSAFLGFCAAHPESICQPARSGKPRHPVVFPRVSFLELAPSPGPTLRDFLASRNVCLWESNDAGLDLDLDRPEDYRAALKQYGSSERV